jgi:hypothetical protein
VLDGDHHGPVAVRRLQARQVKKAKQGIVILRWQQLLLHHARKMDACAALWQQEPMEGCGAARTGTGTQHKTERSLLCFAPAAAPAPVLLLLCKTSD